VGKCSGALGRDIASVVLPKFAILLAVKLALLQVAVDHDQSDAATAHDDFVVLEVRSV
jgi:hypothetical protein